VIDEDRFAARVDALAAAGDSAALTELLREDHRFYDQRSAAGVVRMRGWILLALARTPLPAPALAFVLEELDAGHDGYLIAAAARALRSSSPRAGFAPFLLRAIGTMRYRDEAVALETYGAYADSPQSTTAVQELLATLAWLGPLGRAAVPQLEALRTPGGGLSRKVLPDLDRAVDAMRGVRSDAADSVDCCDWPLGLGSVLSWRSDERAAVDRVRGFLFEDHDGATVSYEGCFTGRPSIVAFFYTRCDNPQKCSLTVAKLARVQHHLAERGAFDRIGTAAITYDPGFDLPARLRAYGQERQLRMGGDHRLLRATADIAPLRACFGLGVNFVESLVNRHRIEIYVLDTAGRVAASFSRLHFDEREVVDRAVALLEEDTARGEAIPAPAASASVRVASPALATVASVFLALFPKCPVCWASYMGALGVSSLIRVPYTPWLEPVLYAALALNVASVWWRCRSIGRMAGAHLAGVGALTIVAIKLQVLPDQAAVAGVLLTLVGSAASAWRPDPRGHRGPLTPVMR
jgi:protein SCO1/2